MKKIILLLGLSLASLGALSFDELIYKDEVKPSFDCSKIKYDGKSNDELMICNKIGVRNEFENKKLALVDNIYSSLYQNISKKADKKMKKDFKAISKKMLKERKICIKNMQNTKAGENPILSLLNASDCMQEAYIKALLELMQRAKKDTKTKEVLEQIFKNKVDKYENLLTQSLNTNKDLQDLIDSLAKEDLIDSRAKFKL
ncbi:hypothetical protein [Campylobacter jejuni]|uniref:hypothetical protein n=1 Tax=Campylobacter jejuni TaxID=197 RepID=UPI000F7FF5E2|nr:hypothetical protein [Campylobacter jejuni]EAI3324804.1 hypothetical protein [Campylobacter jejuni]EAI5280688.1 hypothetical protein [Campylobacter jejuni]EAI8398539.1 hypothetical protein [Campylobacter jejuni]EAK1095707.1 hypothetical protein [Campylobacter jejuni]EAW7250579.1 hypothetical protein [Campylobacter jejuni]